MMRSPAMGGSLRRALRSINSILSKPPPPPTAICSPVYYLSRQRSTTLTPAAGFRGDLTPSAPPLSSEARRDCSPGRRKKSGTIIICVTNSEITAIGSDKRCTTSVKVGNYTFGHFIETDDDDKLGFLSPHIAYGAAGDFDLSEEHLAELRKCVGSRPEISLHELRDINSQILTGIICPINDDFAIAFLDCREVLLNILVLDFGQTGVKQIFYPRNRVVAIGTGGSFGMEIAYRIEDHLTVATSSEVKACIERSILNAIVNENYCGGGCSILSWHPQIKKWQREKRNTYELVIAHSQFLERTELPLMLTVGEAKQMISQWRDDILTGNIPQELEAYEIPNSDDEGRESQVSHAHVDIMDNSEPDAEKLVEEHEKSDANRKESGTSEHLTSMGKDSSISMLDIRVGIIKKVEKHPNTHPLGVLEIDAGEQSTRTVVTDIVEFIPPEELQGHKVGVICNMKPENIMGAKSDGIILAKFNDEKTEVKLVCPPASAVVGERITISGYSGEPDGTLDAGNMIWELFKAELRPDVDLIACYREFPLSTSAGFCNISSIAKGVSG